MGERLNGIVPRRISNTDLRKNGDKKQASGSRNPRSRGLDRVFEYPDLMSAGQSSQPRLDAPHNPRELVPRDLQALIGEYSLSVVDNTCPPRSELESIHWSEVMKFKTVTEVFVDGGTPSSPLTLRAAFLRGEVHPLLPVPVVYLYFADKFDVDEVLGSPRQYGAPGLSSWKVCLDPRDLTFMVRKGGVHQVVRISEKEELLQNLKRDTLLLLHGEENDGTAVFVRAWETSDGDVKILLNVHWDPDKQGAVLRRLDCVKVAQPAPWARHNQEGLRATYGLTFRLSVANRIGVRIFYDPLYADFAAGTQTSKQADKKRKEELAKQPIQQGPGLGSGDYPSYTPPDAHDGKETKWTPNRVQVLTDRNFNDLKPGAGLVITLRSGGEPIKVRYAGLGHYRRIWVEAPAHSPLAKLAEIAPVKPKTNPCERESGQGSPPGQSLLFCINLDKFWIEGHLEDPITNESWSIKLKRVDLKAAKGKFGKEAEADQSVNSRSSSSNTS